MRGRAETYHPRTFRSFMRLVARSMTLRITRASSWSPPPSPSTWHLSGVGVSPARAHDGGTLRRHRPGDEKA